MYQSTLKIITLSLILFGNAISLSMEVVDAPKFYTQQLSTDLRRHIFVVAHPSIKNQLKICSKSWHAIGAKQAPNMYQLVNNPSFRASRDDGCYIMMHAALDKNVEVMRTILKCTEQRKFDYDFGVDYLSTCPLCKEKRFMLGDIMYDNQWEENLCEEFEELCFGSQSCREGFKSDLFKACFAGNVHLVEQIVKQVEHEKCYQSKVYECIVISIYNNNPYCLALLSPLINHTVHDQMHLRLLRLAMRKNKKHAFKALVKNNVYTRLNDPVGMHMGQNTTIMDELLEQKDISDLQEYVTLYKQLGGKTWREVTYAEEANKSQLAFMTFCPIQ